MLSDSNTSLCLFRSIQRYRSEAESTTVNVVRPFALCRFFAHDLVFLHCGWPFAKTLPSPATGSSNSNKARQACQALGFSTCSAWSCSNCSILYLNNWEGGGPFFLSFSKPKTQKQKCNEWNKLCSHMNYTVIHRLWRPIWDAVGV